MFGKLAILVALIALVVAFGLPTAKRAFPRLFGGVKTVTVPASNPGELERELKIVTVIGYDAIPAILDPEFASAEEAEEWMAPQEQVIGLSINGDHRAYPIRMLSGREIANDVVGGKPVAVTW